MDASEAKCSIARRTVADRQVWCSQTQRVENGGRGTPGIRGRVVDRKRGIGRGCNARRHSGGIVVFVGFCTCGVLLPGIGTVGAGVGSRVGTVVGSVSL